jgi:hypothetical protein
MRQPLRDGEELQRLLDALCEGDISAGQVRRLEELVLASAEAEAFYLRYMSLQADLARHFGRPRRTADG